MNPASATNAFPLLKRQLAACAMFGTLLAAIIGALYIQHRQREWVLRREQAQHRLDIAYELVSLEVDRVRSDATYLANRSIVRQFVSGDESTREKVEMDFALFVEKKGLYDQLRLLDLNGHETIRVNLNGQAASAVESDSLQDKADRYYFQASKTLQPEEIFVSDFDLNVEHGSIEQPFKPVIRFATPVVDNSDQVRAFLVLNYLGADLLNELGSSPVPGHTLLLKQDGHYVRAVDRSDAWGWLLGHHRTFASQFPGEWSNANDRDDCRLTASGVFAFRRITLGRVRVRSVNQDDLPSRSVGEATIGSDEDENSLLAVSYLPITSVFTASNELLQRLMIFSAGVFTLALVFTRAWARATWSRQQQAQRIAESEERLRELSSRLLRIQEDERRAISREIHDELGQQATAINLDLKLALRNIETGKAEPHLHRAIEENETLLSTLHAFAKRVRPAVLDDLGLADAIETHLADFTGRTGVQVDSSVSLPDAVPNEIADNTFRLVQESLNNVAKHADANTVALDICMTEQEPKTLCLLIRDDGRGNATEGNGRGLGLVGMRERVHLLGGELKIESLAGSGTSIAIELPLNAAGEAEATCP